MEDANCIFCRIVSGKTQARIIGENDNALAFLDAFPLSVGHTLVIPNGKDAGQEVPHVHIHIVPRSVNDGAGSIHSIFTIRPKLSEEEMDLLSNKMKKSLNI